MLGCQLREGFCCFLHESPAKGKLSPLQGFQTQPTDWQTLPWCLMERIRGLGSCEVQLMQGKGPSWTPDSGRNPVCFVPFLGEQKESELSECVFVSSPVTNAVGCFDFTRWTGDFLSTLNKITQHWAREQGVCVPSVYAKVTSRKQFQQLSPGLLLCSAQRGADALHVPFSVAHLPHGKHSLETSLASHWLLSG